MHEYLLLHGASDELTHAAKRACELLPFAPDASHSWQDASGRLAWFGWQTRSEELGLGSHWEARSGHLTAFSGWLWPRYAPWTPGTPWAAQLAKRLDGLRPEETFERFSGCYTITHLSSDGRGFIAPDALGVGGIYFGHRRGIAAIANRADLVAYALAYPDEPSRDADALSWLPFLGFIADDRTGYEGVRLLPQGSYLNIDSKSGIESRLWLTSPSVGREQVAQASEDQLEVVLAELMDNIEVAAGWPGPRLVHLSGGKDSRLVLALVLASGQAEKFSFVCSGPPHDPDVRVAQMLSERFGLDLRVSERPEVDFTTSQFEAAVRRHVFFTSGMFGAWDLKRSTAISTSMTLTGLFGELLRSHYAARVVFDTETDVRAFFAHDMPFDRGQILRREVAERRHADVRTWLEERLSDLPPEDIADQFYLQFRVPRWVGAAAEINSINPASFPLQTLAGLRLGFSMGHAARRNDRLHHLLIERCARDLLRLPLAGDSWRSEDGEVIPDQPEPVQPVSARPVAWQIAAMPAFRPVFEEYLLNGSCPPLDSILDRERVVDILAGHQPVDLYGRVYLFGALGAAIWLHRDESTFRLTADRGRMTPRAATPGPTDRVNVGCGPHRLEGWLNVDVRPGPGVDRVLDAMEPWPFPDASLSYVYGEHFLEYLPIQRALDFLVYAGRALRTGGRMRLSTSNLAWVIATHFTPDAGGEAERREQTLVVNRAFYGWGHQFLWSHELLEHVLVRTGFEAVEFFAYGESHDPNLRGLERHGGYSVADGRPSVVIVEAARGEAEVGIDPELMEWVTQEFVRHVEAGH